MCDFSLSSKELSNLIKPFLIIFGAATISLLTGCSRIANCCPQASKLLLQPDAESISGLQMSIAYDNQDQKGSACSYNGSQANTLYSVSLNLHSLTPEDGAANELSHRQGAAKYGSVESITNVGESGFLAVIDNLGETKHTYLVYARKGRLAFQLHADSIYSDNQVREKILKVAQIIATRLE